jgi:putative Mn2+ efflux pump MntP
MLDKVNEFLEQPLAQKVLFFNEMLTPSLIRAAYWLCLLAILWTGLGQMFAGGFSNFLEGIVYIVTGAILARVGAELIILFFKLNENMEQVASNTKAAPARITQKKTTKKTSKKINTKK